MTYNLTCYFCFISDYETEDCEQSIRKRIQGSNKNKVLISIYVVKIWVVGTHKKPWLKFIPDFSFCRDNYPVFPDYNSCNAMASMAAAYYQQLSLSLSGPPAGISGGQFLQPKWGQTPSQLAAALASNPHLLHSLPPPPSSAQGSAIINSNPLNTMSMHRYHGIPEPSTTSNSPFHHLNMNLNNQIAFHEVSLANSSLQNALLTPGTFSNKISPSNKFTASRDQQTSNENSFWASNYGNLSTAWEVNQLYNFKKGKLK